jgi:hypothetical protein
MIIFRQAYCKRKGSANQGLQEKNNYMHKSMKKYSVLFVKIKNTHVENRMDGSICGLKQMT